MADELRDLGTLAASDFSPFVGEKFELRYPEGSVSVTLSEVDEREGSASPDQRAPFSALFEGNPEEQLRQGSYRIEHSKFGAAEAVIVPIGPGRYELTFS